MDGVLGELSFTVEYIRALALDIHHFLWDVEYININLDGFILFPAFYGKIWTPPGYAVDTGDKKITAYNGYITNIEYVNGITTRHKKNGRTFYTYLYEDKDVSILVNDDPENIIKKITAHSSMFESNIIEIGDDFSIMSDKQIWLASKHKIPGLNVWYHTMSGVIYKVDKLPEGLESLISYAKTPIVRVQYDTRPAYIYNLLRYKYNLLSFKYDSLSYNLVRHTPKPNTRKYYCAKSIQDVFNNHTAITSGLRNAYF